MQETVEYFVYGSITLIRWLTQEYIMMLKYQFGGPQKRVDHGDMG